MKKMEFPSSKGAAHEAFKRNVFSFVDGTAVDVQVAGLFRRRPRQRPARFGGDPSQSAAVAQPHRRQERLRNRLRVRLHCRGGVRIDHSIELRLVSSLVCG